MVEHDPHEALVAVLQEKTRVMEDRLKAAEGKIDALEDKASRAGGGLAVLIIIGTILAFVFGAAEKVYKWLH